MADQPFQRAFVAGRRDHRVRGDPGAVGQHHRVPVERPDRRHGDHRAVPHRVDQPDVLDGDRALLDPGVQARVGAGEAVRRQVGYGDTAHQAARPVDEPDREPADQDGGGLGGPAGRRAAHDVRNRADRDAYPGRTALDQVHGDLRAGVADTDDQDVLARVRGRGAVLRGVQQLAREVLAARPRGDPRGVVEAGGHHHGPPGQHPAAGRAQLPARAVVGPVDPGDLDARHHLQLVVLGVLLQVAHHVVA